MQEMRTLIPFAFAIAAAPADVRVLPRADGYAVTMEVASSLETEKLVMTLKFAGQSLRLEPDLTAMAGSDPAIAQMIRGAYLIPMPGAKVAFVIPGTGMAMRMNASDIGGTDAPAQRCDDVTIDDLGAGESMFGHATRKHRMRTRLHARGDRPAGEEVIEMWVAPFLQSARGVFKRYAKTFGNQIGNAGCPDQFGKFPEGFPLRIKTTRVGPKGPEIETLVVTSITKMSFTDADFALPPGMPVVDENPFGKRGQ
jgi:hypothetical protein